MSFEDEEFEIPHEALRYYTGFLVIRLNGIYEAWDEGDVELALGRAVRLVFFLPDQLKVKLASDVESIQKEMSVCYGVKSVDWFQTQLARNQAAYRVARNRLPRFVDKLTSLLDARGYFEKQPLRPRAKGPGRLKTNG